MFKVPAWESDVPKTSVDFSKKAKTKKAAKGNIEPAQHVLNPERKKKKQKEYNSQNVPINGNTKKKTKNHKKTRKFVNHEQKEMDTSASEPSSTVSSRSGNMKKKFKNKKDNKPHPTVPSQNPKKEKNAELNKTSNNDSPEINSKKKPKKRKHESSTKTSHSEDIISEDVKPTKAKKIKFTDSNKTETQESLRKLHKTNSKKEKLKKMLELQHRSSINMNGKKLRERMLERLKAAQFRYLNEKLYTSSGNEAKEIFQADPEAFKTYHQGYQQQIKKWPVNPLDVIIKKIQKMPKTMTIADMGCGEAALSKRVPHKVHSFDLVATSPGVTACDMAHTPLLTESVDVVVYCLALMGTELTRYLVEANRVLKSGGQLLIAEVESRFDDVNAFTKDVEKLGYKLKELNKEHSVFFFLHFVKNREPPAKKSKLPQLQLKPCLYKKR